MKNTLKYMLVTSIMMFIGMTSSMAEDPKITCHYNTKASDVIVGVAGSKEFIVSVYSETSATANLGTLDTIDDGGNYYIGFNGDFLKLFAKEATKGGSVSCPTIKLSSPNGSNVQFNMLNQDTTDHIASKEYEASKSEVASGTKTEPKTEVCNFTTGEIKTTSASITVRFYVQGSNKYWAIWKNQDNQSTKKIGEKNYNETITDGEFSYRVSDKDYDNFWTDGKCDELGHYVQYSGGGAGNLFVIQSEKPLDGQNGETHDQPEPVPDKPNGKPFNGCSDMPETTALIRQVYSLIRYLIPILIIILSLVDFAKVAMNGEDKEYKSSWNKFIKRIIVGMIVLIVPMLVSALINLSGIANSEEANSMICVLK